MKPPIKHDPWEGPWEDIPAAFFPLMTLQCIECGEEKPVTMECGIQYEDYTTPEGEHRRRTKGEICGDCMTRKKP